jgi:cbb3-type cytochrome oxidase cytochrome c subunit
MKKKIAFYTLLVALIVIQFFKSPKNESTEILATDITKVVETPESVQILLKAACYDCHSNNTNYPWYNNIQPVAWWLNRHVENGKRHLNFSDFGSYDVKKAKHKLSEIAEVIEEDEMPLFSYTLIHKEAVLDDIQKKQIVVWAKNNAVTYTGTK